MSSNNLYQGNVTQDAEANCYTIFNLCKVGIAASETAAAIDLGEGGYVALFEIIAELASDTIERLET